MGKVDPEDDSVWRCLVQHYRYDPERHQWRSVTIDAYDNLREAQAASDCAESRLAAAQAAGRADSRERISGTWHYPGYLDAQQRGHIVRRAMERGVRGSALRRLLDSGPLPHHMSVVGWDENGIYRYGGGEPPEPPWEPMP